MRFSIAIAFCAVLAGCVSSSGVSPTTSAGLPTAPTVAENNSFATLLNDVRLKNGAGNVAYDARLGVAAQGHANDMLVNNYFSHTGLNGSSVGSRATAAGYNWVAIGENIAQGYAGQAEVMTGWTNSPGHHANNINPVFEDFGIAQAGTGSDKRWVLVLGKD